VKLQLKVIENISNNKNNNVISKVPVCRGTSVALADSSNHAE